jgi:RimJ/RimL family protein N-acetyltransferase
MGIMLEGLLVDLVPYGTQFQDLDHRWHNSEGVFYWAVGGRWFVTRRGVEEHHREQLEELERGNPRVTFGIQTKAGTPIGLFRLNRVHPHHRLSMLSAFIGEAAYWGGGYGTDALLLIVDYAFDWLDLNKVWLQTMSLNERVMRQMEKVGFTLEARQRQSTWANNGWADMLSYGLRREEWPGRRVLVEKLGLRVR